MVDRRRRPPELRVGHRGGANDYEGDPEPCVHDARRHLQPRRRLLDHRWLRVPRRRDPGLYGWYLYGDYCTGFIAAVPADEPTVARAPVGALATSSSFGELEDGEVVVLTVDGVRRVLPG